MARTLIGNFKGPEGPRGEQGPQGEQGPRGAVGPSGADGQVDDINPNLIPMSVSDWVYDEQYSTTTGEVGSYSGRSRLNRKFSVSKGETYTIRDESLEEARVSGIRWYIYDNGSFVESSAISSGQERQIEMTGDEISFVLYPSTGYSNPHQYLEDSDFKLLFKLEVGEEPTKIIKAIHDNERRIDGLSHTAFFEGHFTGDNDSGLASPGNIEFNVDESINIEHTGDEFYLDEGFYFYTAQVRSAPFETGYTFVVDVVVGNTIVNKHSSERPETPQFKLSGYLHIKNNNTRVCFRGSTNNDIDSITFPNRLNNKLFIKKI